MGVLERRGARRPDGTFAEALLAVPPSGADPPAAALGRCGQVVLKSALVEDDLDLRRSSRLSCMALRKSRRADSGGEHASTRRRTPGTGCDGQLGGGAASTCRYQRQAMGSVLALAGTE